MSSIGCLSRAVRREPAARQGGPKSSRVKTSTGAGSVVLRSDGGHVGAEVAAFDRKAAATAGHGRRWSGVSVSTDVPAPAGPLLRSATALRSPARADPLVVTGSADPVSADCGTKLTSRMSPGEGENAARRVTRAQFNPGFACQQLGARLHQLCKPAGFGRSGS